MSDDFRLDLHVHSTYSPDSRLTLDAILGRLSYVGLHGCALTDHNTVDGHPALHRMALEHPEYLFVPGVEVSTAQGHLLAYGVSAVPPPHRPMSETIEWVRAHGGEPVVAHPFRWRHGAGGSVTSSTSIRTLETRNGHNSELANARADLLAAQHGWGATGGSDAHDGKDLGRTYTEWTGPPTSVDDLLEGIRRGRTVADGIAMPFAGRVQIAAGNTLRFVGRGFRSV
jgi:predicted metal-dependent phosphoesterase TrpH